MLAFLKAALAISHNWFQFEIVCTKYAKYPVPLRSNISKLIRHCDLLINSLLSDQIPKFGQQSRFNVKLMVYQVCLYCRFDNNYIGNQKFTFLYQVLFRFHPLGHVLIKIVVQLRLRRNGPLKLWSGSSELAPATIEIVAAAIKSVRVARAGTNTDCGRRWGGVDFNFTGRPLLRWGGNNQLYKIIFQAT